MNSFLIVIDECNVFAYHHKADKILHSRYFPRLDFVFHPCMIPYTRPYPYTAL